MRTVGMPVSDVKQQSGFAREHLYTEVKRQILSGELAPGEALSENELARAHDVSRTPAREAIRRLALERLVDVVPKRGTFVAALPSARAVRQLYEFREAVAGMSARLAASAATPADTTVLHDLIAAMERAETAEERGRCADEFIAAIDDISRNELLREANQTLLDQLHRLRQDVMRHDESYFEGALSKRRELVSAIETGDADRAEQLAREIVRNVQAVVMRYMVES